MNNSTKLKLILVLTCFTYFYKAQNIRDRWDTLYANVDYANTTTYLRQSDNAKFGNTIAILNDSTYSGGYCSHFQLFNTTTNSLSTINYTRTLYDYGSYGCSVLTNTSSNTSYVFFGAANISSTTTFFSLYEYNSSTNAITSETVSLPFNIHGGVLNQGFFSPTTNHDSLTVFVSAQMYQSDSVYIYRKHYAQAGLVNTNIKLPVNLNRITQSIIFNNELYIAGHTFPDNGKILKSSDGITFSVVSNYENNWFNEYVVEMTILNNKLYLGLRNAGGGFEIIETADGTNYTSVMTNLNPFSLNSLIAFNNTIWYSYFEDFGSKTANPSQNINTMSVKAPYVGYLNMSTSGDVLSIDTLGRPYSQGDNYKLQTLNSKLYLLGNYYDNNFNNTPGTFVYEFIPPVANFSISSNNLCLGTPYTFVNQSTSTDSVRWFVNTNYNASTSTNFAHSFTTVGSHTLGLIAISGTQKDTLQFAITIYSIGINLNSSVLGCLNNKIPLTPTIVGAVNPVSYNWTCSAALTQTSLVSSILNVTATASGSYTFALSASDANGCAANTGINTLTINPNKDLTGSVDVSSVPLTAGNVILYKYEPILTKFDSVTYQPLNASGTYTFALQNAFTYILKCEPSASTLLISYAPSETSWKTATVVTHGCVNGTTQNINVIPLATIGTGPGVLSGKITEGQNYGGKGTFVPGNPIGGISIKGGKNPGGGISAQAKTDATGGYTFASLPLSGPGESYFILVDVPGLDTNGTYHKALTSTLTAHTDLDFVIDSAKINPTLVDAAVKELIMDASVVRIFPNPTNGILNIQFELDKAQIVEIILNDITGKNIKTIVPAQQYFSSDFELNLDLGHNHPGIYMLKIKIGEIERVNRLVITE